MPTQPAVSATAVERGRAGGQRSQPPQQQQEGEYDDVNEQPYAARPAAVAVRSAASSSRGKQQSPLGSGSVGSAAGRTAVAVRSTGQHSASTTRYDEDDNEPYKQPQPRPANRVRQTAATAVRQQQATQSATVSVGRRVMRREVVEEEEEEEELEEEEDGRPVGEVGQSFDSRPRKPTQPQPSRQVGAAVQPAKRSATTRVEPGKSQIGKAASRQLYEQPDEEEEDERWDAQLQQPTQQRTTARQSAVAAGTDRRGVTKQASRSPANAGSKSVPRAAAGGARRMPQYDEEDEDELDDDEPGADELEDDDVDGQQDDDEYDAAAERDADRGHNPDGSLKQPRLWRIRLQHTKSGMGLNKNLVTWTFVHKGERHIVELAHSTFGGKRTIRVDGIVKISEKKVMGGDSKYHLEATSVKHSSRSVMIAVELRPVGVSGVTYELYVDARDYDAAKRYWLYHDD